MYLIGGITVEKCNDLMRTYKKLHEHWLTIGDEMHEVELLFGKRDVRYMFLKHKGELVEETLRKMNQDLNWLQIDAIAQMWDERGFSERVR